MIEWQKKYSTGFKDIDEQHQWIFEFVNNLENQLKRDADAADVEQILNSLSEYAKIHFSFEERCMVKCKCPVAQKNKSAHEQFIFAYENFMERYQREGHSVELAWKIHDMVEKWIVGHICQIDMEIKTCQPIEQ